MRWKRIELVTSFSTAEKLPVDLVESKTGNAGILPAVARASRPRQRWARPPDSRRDGGATGSDRVRVIRGMLIRARDTDWELRSPAAILLEKRINGFQQERLDP